MGPNFTSELSADKKTIIQTVVHTNTINKNGLLINLSKLQDQRDSIDSQITYVQSQIDLFPIDKVTDQPIV